MANRRRSSSRISRSIEPLPRLDRGAAGVGRGESLQPVGPAAEPAAGEVGDHLPETGRGIEARMGRGDGVHHHRAPAERVGLEPNSPQLLAMRLEGVELLIGQIQGEWEQEPLGRSPHTAELNHDGFVEHPLVGGMLIHDDHAIRTLVHDVAVEHLDQRDLEASLRSDSLVAREPRSIRGEQLLRVEHRPQRIG